MRIRHRTLSLKTIGRGLRRAIVPVVLAAALLAGCASTSNKATTEPPDDARPAVEDAKVVRDPGGFTITQPLSAPSDARSDYEKAVRMLKDEKYEPGIALLLKVVERAPNLTAAHIDLGIAYARAGDLDHAEASLHKAVELNPKHPDAL